jgi:peptidoglycan/xylan/chitin deacetylase (PgdA/CDA1 family)
VTRVGSAAPARDLVGYGPATPRFEWPGGALVAVSIVLNYEEGAEYSLLDGDARNESWGEHTRQVGPDVRDLATESSYEYGSRAGVWRLCRIFDEYAAPITFGGCALAFERNPELCAWLRARDHDVVGHGYRWLEEYRLDRDAERAYLRAAIASFERTVGQRVEGWYLRSFPSQSTRELLVEEGGFLYDSDACNDDLPYYVMSKGRPFLVLPYSKVHNDARYFLEPTFATPQDFTENVRLAVGTLLREARAGHGSRMLTVGLHARYSGTPNRASAVRDMVEFVQATEGVELMRRIDIARFWDAAVGPST